MRYRVALIIALGLACAAPPAGAIPHQFLGTHVDGPLLAENGLLDGEFNRVVRSGVGSVRMTFDWRTAQPYERMEDVPENQRANFRLERGVPTDWREIDGWMRAATSRHLKVLPVVIIAPDWASFRAGSDNAPPTDFEAYGRFLQSLVERYGEGGRFWAENPDLLALPIRDWQVWNEPHLVYFWGEQPFQREYVKLLRAAHTALQEVDPGGRIILAGFANESWKHIASVYREGGRRYFDAVALHPFTQKVDGVIELIRRARRVMARNRDRRKPLLITELSWSTAKRKATRFLGNETTRAGQAAKIRAALPRLVRERRRWRIESVYWFSWLTRDKDTYDTFDFSGLGWVDRRGRVHRKPAYRAFRKTVLRLVGCRRKVRVADRCAS